MTERSTTTQGVPPGEYVPTADQRVVMHGIAWSDFESIVTLRGEQGPRVTYLKGTLELMSPSRDLDTIKKRLALLAEAYLNQLGITYAAAGSWLLKNATDEVGAEPDECYVLHDTSKTRPDLAIEVVWTSGGINKLEVYRQLGIAEVWFWRNNVMRFYSLGGSGYEERPSSSLIPAFDAGLLTELLALDGTNEVYQLLRKRFG